MTFSKKIENTANILIIVLALVLIGILAKKYFLPSPNTELIKVGEKISADKIDFTKAEKTILVALHPDCHFCQESKGFYQGLIDKTASDNNVQLLALFSPEVENEKEFLDGLSVGFEDTKKISFSDLKIDATPTILVIKKDGTVESVWVGKLSTEKETEFFNKLNQN